MGIGSDVFGENSEPTHVGCYEIYGEEGRFACDYRACEQ